MENPAPSLETAQQHLPRRLSFERVAEHDVAMA